MNALGTKESSQLVAAMLAEYGEEGEEGERELTVEGMRRVQEGGRWRPEHRRRW